MSRITMRILENLAEDFQRYFPGKRFGVQGYGEPSRYCLVEYNDGGAYTCVTSWLPAGQLWEVLLGMIAVAEMMDRNFQNSCAGCGDRINA